MKDLLAFISKPSRVRIFYIIIRILIWYLDEDSNSETGIEVDREIIKKLIQIADSDKIKDINMSLTILSNAAMTGKYNF